MSIYPLHERLPGLRKLSADAITISESASEQDKLAAAATLAARVGQMAITTDGPGNYKVRVTEQRQVDRLNNEFTVVTMTMEKTDGQTD